MNSSTLKSLSKLEVIRSSKYFEWLNSIARTHINDDSYRNRVLNIYAAYIYITEPKPYSFSGTNILNNSHAINEHLQLLIGFIYSEISFGTRAKYDHTRYVYAIFSTIASNLQLSLSSIDIKKSRISDDITQYIVEYNDLDLNQGKLNYLNGWQIKSKEGAVLEVNLDSIFCQYGSNFTEKIHHALQNYGLKHKSATLKSTTSALCYHLLYFFTLNKNQSLKELYIKLSARNVQHYFAEIMDIGFARAKIEGHDENTFYILWNRAIQTYIVCFIKIGFFEAPIKPFLTPKWKKPVNENLSFSIGGKTTENEAERWFSNIGLHIKDEEAVAEIQYRLNKDLNYIHLVCTHIFEQVKAINIRNKKYLLAGKIKPLKKLTHNDQCPIGPENLENTIATFFHHGIGGKHNAYSSFLGFVGNTPLLTKELALPTLLTLNAILSLLILNHPKITPSWLQEWELLDKKGNRSGYKQVGDQWMIISLKNRRGATLAQQEVVLNKKSKEIVDFLIEHTLLARERLKALGDANWRKMIITATPSKVATYKSLGSSLSCDISFYETLRNYKNLPHGHILNQNDVNAISEIFSLRSLRRHRGLQIYLETESMGAVARALGHKRVQLHLLEGVYLPKPLMDFFLERIIRQFQNSILFEAMKESQYLLDAVDISEGNITEFLEHHGISDIPFYLGNSANTQTKVKDIVLSFDGIVFTISTALLQLLIAIKTTVETAIEDTQFKEIVEHWYQCALFILLSLETDQYNEEDDYKNMLENARANPMDNNRIMGALIC